MDWKQEADKIWTRIEQLKSEDVSDEEIQERIKTANLKNYEEMSKFMLEGGLSKPDVKNFWRGLMVGHDDPINAYDSGDYK